jgi:biopolymer transport protein ExbD
VSFIGGAGGRSFRGRRRARGSATVELTSLIDIVFQLLIFFLLTATFQDQSSLEVNLTRAKNKEQASQDKAVVVSIDDEGRFEVDHNIVDERELELRLCKEFEAGRTTLHIRADRDSRHETLVHTMDIAKACKFKKLGILHQN